MERHRMNAFHRRPSRHVRRGNTMILVAGILVLLAILAATFLTRAQGVRVTGTASQQLATSENAVDLIKRELAGEVTTALFAWPVNPNFLPNATATIADANAPRIPPFPGAIRFGIDQDQLDNATGVFVAGGDGFPDHPYAFAPFVTKPWTNWPDNGLTYLPSSIQDPLSLTLWPAEASGDPNRLNPLGNPGYGDTRWLRDLEPLRWSANIPADIASDRPDAFLFYPHLTNLSRPNNGWRVVKDASDVTDFDGDGIGGLNDDLNIPFEQWLRSVYPDFTRFNPLTGDTIIGTDFIGRWDDWFERYWLAFRDPSAIPPNFYNLKDLDADGIYLENGETPRDEFAGPSSIWPFGSPRWTVGRVLVDTDGDGFTDAFWHLAPTPVERGIRHIVAVSVIDNNGLVNGLTGSQFDPLSTAGETPADIALVGEWANTGPGYHVGLFDNWENWSTYQAWDWPTGVPRLPYGANADSDWINGNNRWPEYVAQLNITNGNVLLDPYQRRQYWQAAGLNPFNAAAGLTPFTLADEIELRMYSGSNYPWILSRFERAVSTSDGGLMRSSTGSEETNPYKDQLNNPELLHDTRHRITLFNGARNEELAPWLRREVRGWPLPQVIQDAAAGNPEDLNGNGVADVVDRYVLQQRTKLDLREGRPDLTIPTLANLQIRGSLRLHERLTEAFILGLTDGDGATGGSYLGQYAAGSDELELLRIMAAGWAANVLAFRDPDAVATLNTTGDPAVLPLETNGTLGTSQVLPQVGAVPLPEIGDPLNGGLPADETTRMLGMERQPFLLEAFLVHVHEATPLPPNPDPTQFADLYEPLANHVHSGSDLEQKTIVVVQIANPFDRPIPIEALERYRISVFGKELDLSQLLQVNGDPLEALPAATEDRPATAIFAMIPDTFAHGTLGAITDFRAQWIDFLDLSYNQNGIDLHPNETQFYIFASGEAGVGWDDERRWYDGWNVQNENAIELRRLDLSAGLAQPQFVVVDRFDYDEDDPEHDRFRDQVQDLVVPPGDLGPFWGFTESTKPGIRVGDNDFFVAWTRVTRAWGWDIDWVDGDPLFEGIQPRERAPRYVFANEGVFPNEAQSADLFDGDIISDAGEANRYEGGAYEGGQPAETPWFSYEYKLAPGVVPIVTRKPSVFDGFSDSGTTLGVSRVFNSPYAVDKCFYGVAPNDAISTAYPGSLQMLQKDADFQQIGELMNVWLFGHELEFDNTGLYVRTERTFSEWMRLISSTSNSALGLTNPFPGRNSRHVNRLDPSGGGGAGFGDGALPRDPRHAMPALPAGLRTLDAFVCDGPGLEYNPATDVFEDFAYGNAAFFQGRATPGLLNINTASEEALATLPHWYRLVHWSVGTTNDVVTPAGPDGWGQTHPKTAVPQAAISYRERFFNTNSGIGYPNGPDYSVRPGVVNGDRGFSSIGELRLLDFPGLVPIPYPTALGSPQGWTDIVPDAWRISFAGDEPFDQISLAAPGANISSDVNPPYHRTPTFVDDDAVGGVRADPAVGDLVAQDAEEANLLFAGASNLVTTRSDVFTVYFKVRSFRQSENGAWDATNPEAIVDEGRYMMLVDRSQVNKPSDKPRILYFEKLPN